MMTRVPTFVLVHGAFHGGWCWRMVGERLAKAGGRVFAPTLTGLGERAHLLAPGISHQTFVADVLGVIAAEELDEIVLVGHSFGGTVISGVAERAPDRLRHLVYLDSIIPRDGQSPMDILPPGVAAARLRAAQESSGGLSIPAPPPSVFGLAPGPLHDWVGRRITPQPLASYTDPLSFAAPIGNGRPRTYVLCNDPLYGAVAPTVAWVRGQPGWQFRELAACHDAMVTEPGAVADLLLQIAEG